MPNSNPNPGDTLPGAPPKQVPIPLTIQTFSALCLKCNQLGPSGRSRRVAETYALAENWRKVTQEINGTLYTGFRCPNCSPNHRKRKRPTSA